MEFNSTSPLSRQADFGIVVAIRIRPFNKKELSEHAATQKQDGKDRPDAPNPIIDVERDMKNLMLLDPHNNMESRATFTFDHIYSAFAPSVQLKDLDGDLSDDDDDEEAIAERSQKEIYATLGKPLVKFAWDGYNACIFAYGQTSSGKTYTMMGTKRDPGIIPRLCRDLFEKIENDEAAQLSAAQGSPQSSLDSPALSPSAQFAKKGGRRLTKVTVSYMEIYNEQVRDLLKPKPKNAKPKFSTRMNFDPEDEYQSLKVRQHPLHGPFVEGITTVDVDNWLECVKYIRQGNDVRSQCATEMNESSSRSHAIFQMVITQTEALGARVRGKDVTNHKVSKVNLVDLAGSERILRTNVTGKHLQEANSINQSLSTLRRVIDALVNRKKCSQQSIVVPYRESMLTWILSDNFGGNSKTAMIANVSPHSSNFSETESTLRYATLARGIINRVRVNEDPSAKLIRELQNQLKALQEEMQRGPQQSRVHELEEEINESKRAISELQEREERMQRMISESKAREEKLRTDVETHQKGEERWKQEAEKLRKEKEELKKALTDIAKTNPELMLKNNKQNFWMLDLDDLPETASEEQQCPASGRRKSNKAGLSASRKGSASNHTPRKLDATEKINLKSSAKTTGQSNPSTALSKSATGETPASVGAPVAPEPDSLAAPDTSQIEVPKYGRRALTEEGSGRSTLRDVESARDGIMSAGANELQHSSALIGLRVNSIARVSSSVPLSLQHLAGLSSLSVASTAAMDGSTPPRPPQAPISKKDELKGVPDSLDSFLSGDPQKVKSTARNPPWRAKK
jgi:hypothetical protein